uniref:C2H2-type domain-containing protein n=1 Tax=Macrostomum lignano TaxID=282301 RepID=A0A1I8I1F0_9PLAT
MQSQAPPPPPPPPPPLSLPMSISLSPLTASVAAIDSKLSTVTKKSLRKSVAKRTMQPSGRGSANRMRAGEAHDGGGGVGPVGGSGAAVGGVRASLHPGAYFNRLPSLRAARRLRRRYLQLLHQHSQGQPSVLPTVVRKRTTSSSMNQTGGGKRGRRESSVLHICDQCNRRCFGKKNLVIHKATCHGTPPQKTIYCCLGRAQDGLPCGEKDEDLATMKRHVMINHIKIDPYICKLCNPEAVFTVGLHDKHLYKQHGSFCTRENAHRHLLQQSSHECIASMRRSLNPNSDATDNSPMRQQQLAQWRTFSALVKKEFCGVVQVSDDLKQRLIGDENSSCNVCQLDLSSPEALRSHFEAQPNCEVRFACPHCSHDLLGPEQFLEHLKAKHGDFNAANPRACVTKKVVWLKRSRQRPAKTADEQPLDLTVAAAKDDSGAIDDSGCPLTPAKDSAMLNPFLNAWSSPVWPGLFPWPFSYPQLLAASGGLPGVYSQAATAGATAAAATSTPAAPDLQVACATPKPQQQQQQQRQEAEEAVVTTAAAEAAVPGGPGSVSGGLSNCSDSDGEGSPLKKKAKKNSYKDAPNLIFCPFNNCKQSFPWMSSLKRHIITHTSHKPYCCTRCTQSFSTKSNRERHMERIHHIKVKGNHAFLSTDELSTFSEHDKVAEKIGEELLNQLGNNVVTSVNPQRLLQRPDCCDQDSNGLGGGVSGDRDSALSTSPSHHSLLSASIEHRPPTSSFSAVGRIADEIIATSRRTPVFKCPECQFSSAIRRDALEHLRFRHVDVWQLVAARSRLATVDAVMADGAAAPCSDEDEPADDDTAAAVESVNNKVDDEVDDEELEYDAVSAFGAVVTTDEEAEDEDELAGTIEGCRLLCLVCNARLWSPRQLRRHMRGHTGCKPHRSSS